MILIIDSGATKSSWKYIEPDEQFHIEKLKGFNLSTTSIHDLEYPDISQRNKAVSSIYFFGAGTGNPEREKILKTRLSAGFPNVQNWVIGSDLFSAALAMSYEEKSIISILGTGSNCCLFDGYRITQKINNLGYILGDEGSGFQMGKRILTDFFYNKMDNSTHSLFKSEYGLTRDELIQKVYHENTRPNAYIAGFTYFLSISSQDYRISVSEPILDLFFRDQLNLFKRKKDLPHHFSGSISWHFRDTIKKLCSKYECKIGNIIQNPIDSLSYSKLKQIQN